MGRFLLGLLLGLFLIPLCGYLYLKLGLAPAATSASPMPFETTLANMALQARIAKEAPKQSPMEATAANLAAGARTYRTNCAVCHGLPDQPETAIAKGMFPKVPQLFKGHGVTDDSPGETYWKVANGIRLTGMPAFEASLGADACWQVSMMLAGADKLPADVQAMLRTPEVPR